MATSPSPPAASKVSLLSSSNEAAAADQQDLWQPQSSLAQSAENDVKQDVRQHALQAHRSPQLQQDPWQPRLSPAQGAADNVQQNKQQRALQAHQLPSSLTPRGAANPPQPGTARQQASPESRIATTSPQHDDAGVPWQDNIEAQYAKLFKNTTARWNDFTLPCVPAKGKNPSKLILL